jgi:glycosyltransferase involved in cell wall biosynthesis
MKDKGLLCYMDFATHTGFSSVAHNLLDRMLVWFEEHNYNVTILATNYLGEPFWYKGANGGVAHVKSAKSEAKNMNDLWYRDGFLKVLNTGNWDLVWVINDIPVVSPMMEVLNTIKNVYKVNNKQKIFKSVLYTPVDSPCNKMFMKDLEFWDALVTYTEYGKKEISKFTNDGLANVEIGVIPHSANRKDFFPIPNFDKKETRIKHKLPVNGFIFGNINKNNSRKNIGGTLLAFKKFLDYYKDESYKKPSLPQPYLYLHCSPTDETGINCYRATESLGITDYVVYPQNEDYIKGKGYDVKDMNEVYNCIDAYVTTTTAEGWGLTITEAMAVGLPIVAPMHTSVKEICENGSACYPITILSEQILTHDYENIRYMPDPVNTAWAMKEAYKDAVSSKYPHKLAYEDILDQYDWDKAVEQWKKVFSKLM